MNITKLHSPSEIEGYLDSTSKYPFLVLDLETTGLDRFNDKILQVWCTYNGNDIVYWDFDYNSIDHGAFNREGRRLRLVCHNFKFDFMMLMQAGILLTRDNLYADTMLLDHLENENESHALDAIVKRKWNDNYKEVFWNKYDKYEDAPIEAQESYASKDVYYTYELVSQFIKNNTKSIRQWDLDNKDTDNTDVPPIQTTQSTIGILASKVREFAFEIFRNSEYQGINIDSQYLGDLIIEYSHKIEQLVNRMRHEVSLEIKVIEKALLEAEQDKRKTERGKLGVKPIPFSFDSNLQVATLLYDNLEIKEKRNKSGNRTVDYAALKEIEKEHPIVTKLLEYRECQKIQNTFLNGILERQIEGKIYPSFNVNGTVTGRTSSSNPNLQQLPKEGNIRGIFIPSKGRDLISADYAQLEIVIAAHYSQDKNLLKIIYEDASQHDITAKGLGIPRDKAKTMNFAIQYGAGKYKIAFILGCTIDDAEYYLNKYWETYSGLHKLVKECHNRIDKGLPIVSIFGRMRRFPKTFPTRGEKEHAYRQSVSSLIQGTGADITNMAYTAISQELDKAREGRALFVIHDEVLLETNKEASNKWVKKAKWLMESMALKVGLSVPLKASVTGPMDRWKK